MNSTRLFHAAVAVIGLHVIDDSFLQPQPGTSAGDHLVSGLVPLAVLAIAALAYPRMRAGLRGVVEFLFGFAGIAAGSEAVYYTFQVGPSGDDFTGLLAIPAGLVLIGLSVRTLWTSRRTDDQRAWRYGRRALLTAGAYVAVMFVVVPIGMTYTLTHVARPPVEDIDLGTTNVQKATLETSDGLTLRGSYVPSRNGAAVIVAFGRSGTQKHARMLVRHGYGVLIFDRRGEGRSDGDPNPFAWDEGERDLRAAIDYLKHRPDVDPGRIGGLGLSVGGETLLQTAARTDDLKAVVSEGASSRSAGELASLPGAKLSDIVATVPYSVATEVFSDARPPEHLVDQVDQIAPERMFLIFATEGTKGEELKANPAFHRANGGQAAIWEIPEAGHVGGLKARPREYEQRVTGYFDRALLGDGDDGALTTRVAR